MKIKGINERRNSAFQCSGCLSVPSTNRRKVKASQSDLSLMKHLCGGFGRAVCRRWPASLAEVEQVLPNSPKKIDVEVILKKEKFLPVNTIFYRFLIIIDDWYNK